jgi:ADP-heptose:LPS heptosyltransferase
MKSALLLRLGGLGDIIILTIIAKQLQKRGYEVDLCAGSPTGDMQKILGNTKCFRTIYPMGRHPMGLDIYKVNDSDWAGVELIKEGYDLVVDYKASVELNSHYKHMVNGPGKEWFISQNSNYVNWVDIMLGWANIDPTTVPDEEKVPSYVVEEEEREWASKIVGKKNSDHTIAIQLNASSLVRTWYDPAQLPKALKEEYPDKKLGVILFDGQQWHKLSGKYDFPIIFPDKFDPIRASAALVEQCDLLICADSGFSHVAEAMKVKSLTVYTTVPAWTRMRYYKYAKAIEPVGDTFLGVQCRPCFTLDRYCPRIREKALEELTPREKIIKAAAEAQRPPDDVARELKTTPQGVVMEAEMLQKRYNALLEQQAPCSATITVDRILNEVRGML